MTDQPKTSEEMAPFIRENRYIVVKISKLNEPYTGAFNKKAEKIRALAKGATVDCVVIESDWPEYGPAWRMIEARVNGAEPTPAVGGDSSSLNGKPDDYESRRSWTVKDWYTHLGAWENDKGQLCFGSTIAFAIMLEQFHRTHTAPLLAQITDLVEQKSHLVEMREMHGFDSWAAALVALDKANARIAELEAQQGSRSQADEELTFKAWEPNGNPCSGISAHLAAKAGWMARARLIGSSS